MGAYRPMGTQVNTLPSPQEYGLTVGYIQRYKIPTGTCTFVLFAHHAGVGSCRPHHARSGGTGRRARLRISWVTVGFKSPLAPDHDRAAGNGSAAAQGLLQRKGYAPAMKMEVTELGPMKRALKIEVPADEVTQRLARAYVELNRQVNIPGFRPGKAPLALLEKRYAENRGRGRDPKPRAGLLRQGRPPSWDCAGPRRNSPLDRVKIKKDEPFTFTATVEIKPNNRVAGL